MKSRKETRSTNKASNLRIWIIFGSASSLICQELLAPKEDTNPSGLFHDSFVGCPTNKNTNIKMSALAISEATFFVTGNQRVGAFIYISGSINPHDVFMLVLITFKFDRGLILRKKNNST
jgi:hypothetical protein